MDSDMDSLKDLSERLSAAVVETGIDQGVDGPGFDGDHDQFDEDHSREKMNGEFLFHDQLLNGHGHQGRGLSGSPNVSPIKVVSSPGQKNSNGESGNGRMNDNNLITLDEFRNSSFGSAKAAIDSLLTSERVLRPLRSLILQSYIKNPQRFSLNLGELLSELAEEEQTRLRLMKDGDSDNKGNGRQKQKHHHQQQKQLQEEEEEMAVVGGHDRDNYYLQVDMLEVELANILGGDILLEKGGNEKKETPTRKKGAATAPNPAIGKSFASSSAAFSKKKKKQTKAVADPLGETVIRPTPSRQSRKSTMTKNRRRDSDTPEQAWTSLRAYYSNNASPAAAAVTTTIKKKKKKKRASSKGLSRLLRETASSRNARYVPK